MHSQLLTVYFFFVKRSCYWYVGRVLFYCSHYYNDEVHFLAVIETMKHHKLDDLGIPTVTENTLGEAHTKIAVCDIRDIVKCVGLVQYSNNVHKFKVIWPYNMYYKKVGGRTAGDLRLI